MTIAIKFGDSQDVQSVSGVIYFDAVTKWEKTYGGKTTQHPIESGASITDHYISDNKKYKLSGVISSVDFSPLPSMIVLDGENVSNINPQPTPVQVMGDNPFSNLIPDILSQILGTATPSISMDNYERVNHGAAVEGVMEQILHGLYYNQDEHRLENKMTLTTLFEMENGSTMPSKTIENLVITKFGVSEDPETGDALQCEMELEQVSFVMLQDAEAPTPTEGTKASRATAKEKDLGSNTKVPETPNDKVTIEGLSGDVKGNVSTIAGGD